MAAVHPSSSSARSAITGGFKVRDKLVGIAKEAIKIGRDDPRKLTHCVKVGLALTLISLLYYFNPLYDAFGQSGILAVLTVFSVFEFTVGETLSKCFNNVLATLLAASLGIGVVYLTQLLGQVGQPFILGTVIFILVALSNLARFFDPIENKYNDGVMVFILTFIMIAISGDRVEKIWKMCYQRVLAVIIANAICIIISIIVFPVWAAENLPNLVADNIDKVAKSLEEFGKADEESVDKAYDDDKDYEDVINSKDSEKSLAIHAWWEFDPCGFGFGNPWDQYIKVGDLVRECASHIQSLSCLAASESHQAPTELARRMKEACTVIYSESIKALRELSSTIKTMTHPSPDITTHLESAKAAIADLQASLQLDANAQNLRALDEALIIIKLTAGVDKIWEATQELSENPLRAPLHDSPSDDNFSTLPC
ncbi:aluminum-activated malate transporter 8-like [Ipomoea triloba]|uniref:aluminum-activated malate transporter 8-like n=1 Tax=Ipomoea triloba TaxID=35885 RepID=UPI00125E6409|nr:aluminum-activated malate transporter 8-like [Ipomoea triloba]